MADKERLEEIKKKYFMYENYTGKVIMYHHVLEWLIEQAERVHELEQQNKRYRKALEEIRDIGIYGKIISTDEANLAEEALEGEKEEKK